MAHFTKRKTKDRVDLICVQSHHEKAVADISKMPKEERVKICTSLINTLDLIDHFVTNDFTVKMLQNIGHEFKVESTSPKRVGGNYKSKPVYTSSADKYNALFESLLLKTLNVANKNPKVNGANDSKTKLHYDAKSDKFIVRMKVRSSNDNETRSD